jgi:hypothetical protein
MQPPKISDKERSEMIMKIYFPQDGSILNNAVFFPDFVLHTIEDWIKLN